MEASGLGPKSRKFSPGLLRKKKRTLGTWKRTIHDPEDWEVTTRYGVRSLTQESLSCRERLGQGPSELWRSFKGKEVSLLLMGGGRRCYSG